MIEIDFDSEGLIIQKDGDGGDCAARSGTLVMGLKIRELLSISNDNFEVSAEGYWQKVRAYLVSKDFNVLRYDKPPYMDPKDVPGDQLMPIAMSAALMGENPEFYYSANVRWFRFPNGDLCGPSDTMILKKKSSLFGYADLLGAAILRCYLGNKNPDDVGDDIRLTQTLAFLRMRDGKDSAALKYYRKHRDVQKAWDWYFRPETNANPLNELWRPIIETFFK